jgi:hypothetical protein
MLLWAAVAGLRWLPQQSPLRRYFYFTLVLLLCQRLCSYGGKEGALWPPHGHRGR